MKIILGDAYDVLKTMDDESVDCCVTSPPYYKLRDYDMPEQIGNEPTLEGYISNLILVFAEVKRVLRKAGTLWLNLADKYEDRKLLCVPWRVAFALQASDWHLRQDIIWHKPNPMPESVTDRCTKAHEYIFLLSKSEKYHYDTAAVKEPYTTPLNRYGGPKKKITENLQEGSYYAAAHRERNMRPDPNGRNRRSVWTVPTKPYKGAHFAVFPEKLIEPCILAGCPKGGVVLDPFSGSGTTGVVAIKHDRDFIGIELNPAYKKLAEDRIGEISPLFLNTDIPKKVTN